MNEKSWKWYGYPGHFCAAMNCRFHMHTHVGRYCVSTVGDYHPPLYGQGEKAKTIGLGRLFETMVFNCTEDDNVTDYTELDMEGYNLAEDARIGHMNLCDKYSKKRSAKK